MIPLRRTLLIALAGLFSAYHVFLAISSLGMLRSIGPTIVALCLYAVATIATLWVPHAVRMASWLAAFDLAVCIAMPLLVASQLDPHASNGYATWYVAAVGTLLTIVAVRRRQVFAWVGLAFLTAHTLLWAGIGAFIALGVIGSVVWVTSALVVVSALGKASRDALQFAQAERQAAEWQAAQEAHLSERQHRLEHTYRMAAPLLNEIVRTGGDLSEEERAECRLLESAMRDEIRGRGLLNDDVRDRVMAARRRGTTVSLLDEGGLDSLDDTERDGVLHRLADAIARADADRLVVRTVPRSETTAVTVVGLRDSADGDDDDVTLWLEIPRRV